MQHISQSPTDPAFVQNPYPFYDRARAQAPVAHWDEIGMPCAFSHAAVSMILRDRRFGREIPADRKKPVPAHLEPFYAVEQHSMLELEPPRHTALRKRVLRAFTSRRIAALEPEIAALTHDLIDRFPAGPFDLLEHFAQTIPVVVICRLLGVPEAMKDQLLNWSHAMVGMYQAGRTRATEKAAARAASDFAAFLRGYVEKRRALPADDLITRLIEAGSDGATLSTEELIATCILLLNAGHEATVHALANGVKALLEAGGPKDWLTQGKIDGTIEEILRFDPPLHLFTRYAYEPVEVMGHVFRPGDQVALLLAAAGRDPQVWHAPHRFNPARPVKPHLAFGAGLHFCLGAPLARLEMAVALPILFARRPDLHLTDTPCYADTYHFHGLTRLQVGR
ncbi:cytochrome P450 [Pararhodobacter sp.]|uniref:cytochrome P450 n=1 Tax=Pararhodobacter sp. TaxID=2127056 RepID=UPI002FDDB671